MRDKKPVIVGVDSGATLGYAVMDVHGNIIAVNSRKQVKLSELILEVLNYGNVVVVGSDVKPASNVTRKLAKKTGARLIMPENSLRIKEKKRLVNKLDYDNLHERDALAAAVYAYKRLRALLTKVDVSLGRKKNNVNVEDVKTLVLSKSNMSIARAVESIDYS